MAEWMISSFVLTALVIALRFAVRGRVSLRLQYALWLIVLLRLLVPFSLGSSAISVANAMPAGNIEFTGQIVAPVENSNTQPESRPSVPQVGADAEYARPFEWREAAFTVWATGACALFVWFGAVNLRLWKTLRRSRRRVDVGNYPLPVYVSSAVETPCLFGLFRPSVYLTEETPLGQPALGHVLEHERTHWRHGDHVWALLRAACLALHWFDPLVWWAAALSRRDAELACDEAAVRRLGEAERAGYGRTLLDLTCGRRPQLLNTATTMTGGRSAIRERILMLTRRPKTAALTLALVIIAGAALAGCTFTGAAEQAAAEPPVSDEPVGDVAAQDWVNAYLEFWDVYDLAGMPQHQGFELIDLEFDGVPELIVWFAGGPSSMHSELYRIEDGEVVSLGSYETNLIKGTLGEDDSFGGPWPAPSYWLVRSRENGGYCWCVSSYSGSEQGSRGGYTLFSGGSAQELASFEDGPGDEAGRLAAWEQFDAEYEVVPLDSSAFTLSIFDGDDLSRAGLEALLSGWEPTVADGA